MSENTSTAVATRAPLAIGNRGIVLNDFDGLWRFSVAVSKSGLAPKGIQSAEGIFVAIQMGLEIGLTPMAALQNIAVINGRPSVWGDAQLAIVRATGELEEFDEYFVVGSQKLTLDDKVTTRNPTAKELTNEECAAVCVVKRRGFARASSMFSIADARTAGLLGKEGPWKQYPGRMLRFRARSFALRDQFGDALKGLLSAEEAGDIDARIANAKPAQAGVVDASSMFGQAAPSEAPQIAPAPVAPVEQPAPQPDPAALTTEQAKVCEIACELGATFPQFIALVEKHSMHPDASSWADWSMVPKPVCVALLKSLDKFRAELTEIVKGGKA